MNILCVVKVNVIMITFILTNKLRIVYVSVNLFRHMSFRCPFLKLL